VNTDQLPLTPEIFKIVCDFYWKDQDPIEITDESIADLVEEALINLELQNLLKSGFLLTEEKI
jgi:hypothetical protein